VEFAISLLPHEPSIILPLQGNGSVLPDLCLTLPGSHYCTAQAVFLPLGKPLELASLGHPREGN
jgi:hypothetical protein